MDNHLINQPIPRLIKKIAVPASIGFFFNTMYNVVDTYFGGLVGTEAVAALSLSFPVFFSIIAIGGGISQGTTALIANALGEGDIHKARLYISQSLSFGFILSVILTIVGLKISPFLFGVLGAEGSYLEIALKYMNVILLGAVFFMLTFVLNSGLTARGDTKTFRNYLILGFFLNAVLDPWFLYGGLGVPALGIAGIAWATVVVQIIGFIYLLYVANREGLVVKECWHELVPRKKLYWEIAAQGFPASLNMMTVALGIFVITYYVSKFGSSAVAAYGIATRVEQMAVLPNIGLNLATLTLVGQNFGAKKYLRVVATIKTALKYGLFIVSIASGIVFLFPRVLMKIFTEDQEVIAIGVGYLKIAALMYMAYIVLYIAVSALQGMKRPLYGLAIGISRQIIGPMIIFAFFVDTLELGITGVWWGIFIITWGAAGITLIYLRGVIGKLKEKEQRLKF